MGAPRLLYRSAQQLKQCGGEVQSFINGSLRTIIAPAIHLVSSRAARLQRQEMRNDYGSG
jgi:hypothetical protein